MKSNFFIYLLILTFTNVFNSCAQKKESSNQIYFTIDPEDRKIVVPAQLNDSINVNLTFDTGAEPMAKRVILDSSILTAYPNLFMGIIPDSTKLGSSWGVEVMPTLIYNREQNLTIGNSHFEYEGVYIQNFKKHMNSGTSDGMFNIPITDSIHVWELNFENNYMEIHRAENFEMPEDIYILPFVNTKNNINSPFCIQLPLQIKCADGDTLTINRTFFIDTGLAKDVVVKSPAVELDFFNKRNDAVWTRFINKYSRYYTVNATLFENFTVDSLRIYTIDYRDNVHYQYLIGLNFLKHFNVFFDMKNKQLGLQPIKNFKRVVNPLRTRFHYSTKKISGGRYIINKMADYKENYYKTAGLREGDEIVRINNVPYGSITPELADKFKKQEYAIYDIIRNGKPLKISITINQNEQQGD